MYRPTLLVIASFLAASCIGQSSADTLSLSLQQTEQQFLQKNLTILAGHYNVDASRALIEQAKLWDNPVLVTDQNVYSNGQFFSHGKTKDNQPNGQIFVQVQQLIKTARKRSKAVDLASTTTQINELQLQDVMRSLKYQLRTNYYTIAQLLGTRAILLLELAEMQHLLVGMEAQFKAGNIALKDYLRIQALQISLQHDITENGRTLNDSETELKTLLQITGNTFIKPSDPLEYDPTTTPVVDTLLALARRYNAAYLLQQKQVTYQQQNLVYQKALKSPDVTVGPEFDQSSNYAPNYVGLTVSLPLNLLNKNQGNIKAASFSIKQEETNLLQLETELSNNVYNAYNKLTLTLSHNNAIEKEFYSKYQTLFNNVLESYRQRQISLLEFIDFFDTYKDANSRLLQQQLNLQLAKEELNFQIGSDLIK